jgi:hypothetical protein
MELTYVQALDLLKTVDALDSGTVELEIDGVRLSVTKEATTEADPAPAEEVS